MGATNRTSDFRGVVDHIRDQLKTYLENNPNGEGWIKALHETYTQRFLSDNNRIWMTGGIMIPVSLAGFAIPVQSGSLSLLPLAVLGFASVGIMLSWLIIAENHRAFQNKSLAWVVAIEESLGLTDPFGAKIIDDSLFSGFVGNGAVRLMRWFLLIGVILGWLSVWLGHAMMATSTDFG